MSDDPPKASAGRLLWGLPAYVPRTPWRAGPALLATGGIVALSFLGAAVLPFLARELGSLLGVSAPPPADSIGAGMRVLAVFQTLAVALTILSGTLFGGAVGDVLALRPAPRGWRSYGGALLAMAALQVVLSLVQYGILQTDMLADLRPFVGVIQGPEWPLVVAVLGVGAPLSEELLFRGFLLGALARTKLGFWGGAAVSTGLWTAMHTSYSLPGLAEVFAIGMLLCWLLWRTGSLRVTIFCHALYNSLIVLALRLADLPAASG